MQRQRFSNRAQMIITGVAATGIAFAISGPVMALAETTDPAVAPEPAAVVQPAPAEQVAPEEAPDATPVAAEDATADESAQPASPAPAAPAAPVARIAADPTDSSVVLTGDMKINDDTSHVSFPESNAGDTVSVQADLLVQPIKDQIQGIADDYAAQLQNHGVTYGDIKLTDEKGKPGVTSSFTAEFTLPEGMKFGTGETVLMGSKMYKIVKVVTSGNVRTVTMELDNPGQYATFQDLYDTLINKESSNLSLTFDAVTVDPGLHTITGTITGKFFSTATVTLYGRSVSHEFKFDWTAKQDSNTWDKANGSYDPDTITVTVKTNAPKHEEKTEEKTEDTKEVAKPKHMAKEIPQTSDASTGPAALLALASAGILSLFGATKLRKQD
ncbi:hypothetical protein [Olsenella sp. HMSC062G07]|uniref:hypothetical protein n=1 Tax=Olsenella sp. HMSC062G07 TaxID=1739330 RepID=UPI0008A46798|nr:hypothetical protein [Olsenella sp. HMSC062G07]OFK24184.1 hypothetical protein HMPREF2826_08130 [Olsenella sp. HMSC062G07]